MMPPSLARRAREHRRALFAALVVVALYCGFNIFTLTWVPLLHRFELRVSAVDDQTSTPVTTARVGWLETNPQGGLRWVAPLATADGTGTKNLSLLLQEQPSWALPQLGTFKFHGRVLRVESPGYAPTDVVLADALPRAPYSSPAGRIDVRLIPRESTPGDN